MPLLLVYVNRDCERISYQDSQWIGSGRTAFPTPARPILRVPGVSWTTLQLPFREHPALIYFDTLPLSKLCRVTETTGIAGFQASRCRPNGNLPW